jgi:AraC-like DNA-binding protein
MKGQIEVSCRHYEGRNVSEGHMIFLSRAGYMHISATEEDSALLFFGFDEITIRTNESLMDFLTSHGNLKAHSNNALPVKKDMMDIVDRVVNQIRKGRIKNAAICQAWHTELFITFITYYTKSEVTEFFRPLVSTNISFRDFVENNYTEVDCNAERLIRYSGMSRGTFLKTFKEEFGTTPKHWLTNRFKKELEYWSSLPNATTSYVASKLGITDVRLCQFTRKHYGITPQQLIGKLSKSPRE